MSTKTNQLAIKQENEKHESEITQNESAFFPVISREHESLNKH